MLAYHEIELKSAFFNLHRCQTENDLNIKSVARSLGSNSRLHASFRLAYTFAFLTFDHPRDSREPFALSSVGLFGYLRVNREMKPQDRGGGCDEVLFSVRDILNAVRRPAMRARMIGQRKKHFVMRFIPVTVRLPVKILRGVCDGMGLDPSSSSARARARGGSQARPSRAENWF